MKKIYFSLYSLFLLLICVSTHSQVTLTGTSYLETFDNIGAGLPAGWTVRSGASATSLGTAATLTTTPTTWSNSSGAFKNLASADGLTAASSATDQNGSTDRALGIRHTAAFGDPGAAFVLQLANTSGISGFTLSFKLQSLDVASPRSVTWSVDYAIGSSPASFTTVATSPSTLPTGSTTFSNNTITVNFGSALDNRSENVWIRIVALTASTGTGNRPTTGIDDFQLNYSTGGSDQIPPSVSSFSPANNATNVVSTLPSASITFDEAVQKGTGTIVLKNASDNSVVQTIDVTSASVTISGNTVSFPVSVSANSSYYIEIPSATIKDIAGNNFAGISGNTGWKFSTGTLLFSASFNTCTSPNLPEGFTQYSVTGAQVWGCTTFGIDASNSSTGSASFGLQINGFNVTNVPNEDWLISPSFDLSGTTYPLLSFWSRTAFNGAPLQLKISTNYSGTGDPRQATWTDLNGRFPKETSDVWTQSSNINLSAFKQAGVYVAFVYYSTDEEGARWTLDNVTVNNSATPPPASLSINTTDIQFDYAASGGNVVKTFTITGNDITDGISVTSSPNFLLSTDGNTYNSTITFTQNEANNNTKTVYVKFSPTQNNLNYTGTATITTSGLTDSVNFKGTSVDPVNTLEVVNWNVEWFGSPAFGPTNENQQEQNVKTILQNIGADIYGLSEVVDTARLGNVVRQLPGNYAYVVSNFGSHTNTTETGASPLSEAQKLAFVYKTSMFSNISTAPLLSQGINTAADVSSTSYNNWSSGRYPFMMSADVTLNGVTKNIKFILIHAKANTSPTLESYNRRKAGADELRTLLSTTYGSDNVILLGDFNDDLDQTITAGITPPTTSYISFVNDSANFPSPTILLSRAGKKSTTGFSDMIDHVVVSNEMYSYYMANSANVLTDAASIVTNYSSSTTDHYPVFTRYAFDAAILPVRLLEFTAIKNGSAVDLHWKTAQEINSKEFIIERSQDAIKFQAIGTVNAAGNAVTEKLYSFSDLKPQTGDNFYRLRQVDKDGKVDLSNILKLNFGKVVAISITPNPANNVVTIGLNAFAGATTVQIVNNTGQIMRQRSLAPNTVSTSIDISGLAPGFYLIKTTHGNKVHTSTLVVQ